MFTNMVLSSCSGIVTFPLTKYFVVVDNSINISSIILFCILKNIMHCILNKATLTSNTLMVLVGYKVCSQS